MRRRSLSTLCTCCTCANWSGFDRSFARTDVATIAIGDIHGEAVALGDLLCQLRDEIGPDDTVVFLGDYVDRGPDARACIDAILEFRSDVPSPVVCLCGNHEDWMLRTFRDPRRHSWLMGMEALDTIRSAGEGARLQVSHLKAGARAAYLHVGALIGTIMVWNVYFQIIPGQRKMVEAIRASRDPDPRYGAIGKQRSVHNTYFTLPVVFTMISNHYPQTYGSRYNWIILSALVLTGWIAAKLLRRA